MSRKKKPSGREVLFQRGRNPGDYLRRAGRRRPQKTILILCEGSQTEPNYFQALRAEKRLHGVRVEVVPGGEDRVTPLYLVKKVDFYIHQMDWDPERDEAWCVFDVEGGNAQRSIQRAVILSRRQNIHLAVSNPAFEFWFLLHFENTDRPFLDGEELKAALRMHILVYEENMAVYPHLRENTEQAIARCRHLRERSEQSWDIYPNPSTGVDLLVQKLWIVTENESILN